MNRASPLASLSQLAKKQEAQVSIVTVSNIREQFWDTIKFLRAEGIANLPERKSNP